MQARVNDGATLEDFKTVHRKKVAEWRGTDMAKYIRPSTLYGSKFDEYLNQAEAPRRHTTSRRDEPKQVDWAARVAKQGPVPEDDGDLSLFDLPDVPPGGGR